MFVSYFIIHSLSCPLFL